MRALDTFSKQLCLLGCILLMLSPVDTVAQETLCASVRIEIHQELAFERQAFDARMLITNGLSDLPLENVSINVHFKDEFGNPVLASSNPNEETAVFFINIYSMSGINDISGGGVIDPESAAEVHWLIVPTAQAAGGVLQGKLYFVGATLDYTINQEPTTVEVAEDFIVVLPQPELELDYFLPADVYADDPLTGPIEPAVPFTLGVRIMNVGLASANNVRIESSQPQIVENEQGLLVGFEITGSFIDNDPADPSLLLSFGDIGPSTARTGRWIMETSLSGEFVSFGATYSHADELGGRLTSLLNEVRTHTLVKDVVVDLPGRDTVKDFLADQLGLLQVYESEGLDSPVTDQSALVSLVANGSTGGVDHYYIDVPTTAGMLYLSVSDPYSGGKAILNVSRDDGKTLPSENVWFAREGTGGSTVYSLRLFDVNGGGRYSLDIGDPIVGPRAPVLQLVPNYSVVAGDRLTFIVVASDPDGTIPQLSVDALPLGAQFTDFGDGTGEFDWQTTVSQAGNFPVTFRASDGVLSHARTPTLVINSLADTDGDGLLDAWEMQHFGTLARDGNGDFDGDGLTDLEEFLLGTDPTSEANAPSVPVVDTPRYGQRVSTLTPKLGVFNASFGVQVPSYEFEISLEEDFQSVLSASAGVSQGESGTDWQVDIDLQDGVTYYWRSRAGVGSTASEWVYGKFFVDLESSAPKAPIPLEPLSGQVLDARTVYFAISHATRLFGEPFGEDVEYSFEITDLGSIPPEKLTISRILQGESVTQLVARIPSRLVGPFEWTATAIDADGQMSSSQPIPFSLNTAGVAPSPPLLLSPLPGAVVSEDSLELVVKTAYDPDSLFAESYIFEYGADKNFVEKVTQIVLRDPRTPTISQSISKLLENQRYFWRVRAFDGTYMSRWSYGEFFVNTGNDAPSAPASRNPGKYARVDLLQPKLRVFPVTDPDEDPVSYHYEIYESDDLSTALGSEERSETWWEVSPPLLNHKTYYWRARAKDAHGVYSEWGEMNQFFVSVDSVLDPPRIEVISSKDNLSIAADKELSLLWADADPDSDAQVKLFLDGVESPLLNRFEDEDEDEDVFHLPPFTLVPGVYQLELGVDDGNTLFVNDDCCTLTVTEPSLMLDADGDGVFDHLDNCPFLGNPKQYDRGGVLSSAPDGIGDACQCGDFSGDGKVDFDDLSLLESALMPENPQGLPRLELCNLTEEDFSCDKGDYRILRKHLEQNISIDDIELLPGSCQAALP